MRKMARCPIDGCGWVGKKGGLAIHLARMHGVHREEEIVVQEVPERLMEPIIERWSP